MQLPRHLETLVKSRTQHIGRLAFALVFISFACFGVAFILSEGTTYDEAITRLVLAGTPYPDWPTQIVPAGELKSIFDGSVGLTGLLDILYSTDVHPPVYFVLASIWQDLFGNAVETGRALSLLFAAGALIILYRLCRSAMMPHPWVPVALCAFSNTYLIELLVMRPYAVAMFFTLLCAYATFTVVQRRAEGKAAVRWQVVEGLAAGAALLTNHFTLFPIAGIALYHLLALRKRPVAKDFCVVIAALPLASWWCYWFLHQSGERDAQEFAGLAQFVTGHVMMLYSMVPGGIALGTGAVFVAANLVVLLVMLALLYGGARNVFRNPRSPVSDLGRLALVVCGLSLIGPLLAGLVQGASLPFLRYLMFQMPFLAVLLTIAAPSSGRMRRVVPVVLGLIIIAQFATMIQAAQLENRREGWGVIAAKVRAEPEGTSLVMVEIGFGRGTPAAMTSELPDTAQIMVLNDAPGTCDDFATIQRIYAVNSFSKQAAPFPDPGLQSLRSCGFANVTQHWRHWVLDRSGPDSQEQPP